MTSDFTDSNGFFMNYLESLLYMYSMYNWIGNDAI